jgi:TonB family protein
MFVVMLAVAALAAPTPDAVQGPAVNVLDAPAETPRFIERPSASDLGAAYPHAAASVGMGGKALLHCQINRGGRLDACRVERESPAGAGFGGAALSMARFFRVDPESEASLHGDVELPIGFATAVDEDHLAVAGPWLAAPSFADVAAAYPDIGGGVAGQVVMRCALERDGSLKACKTLYLKPTDRDFDAAAQKLTHLFRMQVVPGLMTSHQPMVANVVMSLAAPFGDDAKARRIAAPVWLTSLDPALLTQLYPPAAAQKGVHAGVGAADCTVGGGGSLTACHAFGAGDPPGLGFSEAAAKAATSLRMSPWTEAGGPVDGALVRVPIRFNQPAVKYAGQ